MPDDAKNKTAPVSLTDAGVRLECVRLVHRHDWSAKQIVERAAELETYITGGKND